MSEQKYPRVVSIYKGEERYLVVPVIDHIGGYSVKADWARIPKNMEDAEEIGNIVFDAFSFIEDEPISQLMPKERGKAWKNNSKYKGWISFWKNNLLTWVELRKDGSMEVVSTKRTVQKKGGYNGCIKEILLPATATAEDIGRAVIEVFEAAEEFYKDEPEKADKE